MRRCLLDWHKLQLLAGCGLGYLVHMDVTKLGLIWDIVGVRKY